MRKLFGFILLALFVLAIQNTKAQAPAGIKPNLAAGEITKISQTESKISLQTTDGAIDVMVSATTTFKKVLPDNPSITTAVDSSFSDIGEKDKILVTGKVAEDKKTIAAKTVYLMTQSDINKRNQAERELWRTRGISGKVVSVDFKTQNVTISTPARGMAPAQNVVLSPKDNAEYLRYAPDSVKYSDAVASNLAEIKVGDELRALGDKSADGLSFKAEKYVSGSFKTVTGKVTAVDVAKNEVTIEDTVSKKPVVIALKSNTLMKKFPPEQAQMLAMAMSGNFQMMQGGQGGNTTFTMTRPQGGGDGQRPQGGGGNNPNVQGGQGGQRPPQNSGSTPPNGQSTPNPNGGGQPTVVQNGGQPMVIQMGGGNGQPGGPGRGMGGGRGGDLNEIVNNLPNLAIADIKVGDTIGISSTQSNIPNRYTAIKFIAGIEPFLAIPQRPAAGGGQGGQQPTINIPGLDGGIGN